MAKKVKCKTCHGTGVYPGVFGIPLPCPCGAKTPVTAIALPHQNEGSVLVGAAVGAVVGAFFAASPSTKAKILGFVESLSRPASPPAPAVCDGAHDAPACADPKCWHGRGLTIVPGKGSAK